MIKSSFELIAKLLDKLIKYRYFIAVILFLLGLGFQFHGSSIANWNNFGVTENVSGRQIKSINRFSKGDSEIADIPYELKNWISFTPREDGTLIGVPRMIRTDEWLVQTPFYISQSKTGNHLVNKKYGLSGQNMVVAYNAPVKDISVIGKPFNWGFLFLGSAYGLSWYWCMKVLAFLLLSYEFSMILTKKNKYLSIIGSFWITFTPAIQWWFMQHLGDVTIFSLAIMVFLYHYFRQKKLAYKILLACGLVVSLIGFVLVIYPAFQVPFAYIIFAFFLIEIFKAIKSSKIDLKDIVIMVMTLCISLTIIGFTLWNSREAISLTLNTVYPGHRVSTGGEISWHRIADMFLNIILPFKVPGFANQVELSGSINFLPVVIASLPLIFRKDQFKDNILGYLMVIYSIFLMIYSIIGVPAIISKVTLFSYVTSGRSWQALTVISVFASIWFVGYIWNEKIQVTKKRTLSILSITTLICWALVTFVNPEFIGFIGKKYLLAILILLVIAVISIFFEKKNLFAFCLLPLILLSGFTVNPLVKGLGVIENKRLSQEITSLVDQNPNAYWLSEGILYNYPQMFGAHTLNSVRFYPDVKLMKKLDPKSENEESWNRYAHMQIFLTNDKSKMEAPVPDVLNLLLNKNQLDNLHVQYILSHRNLNKDFSKEFYKIYGPDMDGNYIFQYKKK